MKPPPSSYKPTPSRAGNVGTSGGDGRPRSNRGIGFSNKLSEKANQLEGTKYREELSKKNTASP
jgi:hypothetical protein